MTCLFPFSKAKLIREKNSLLFYLFFLLTKDTNFQYLFIESSVTVAYKNGVCACVNAKHLCKYKELLNIFKMIMIFLSQCDLLFCFLFISFVQSLWFQFVRCFLGLSAPRRRLNSSFVCNVHKRKLITEHLWCLFNAFVDSV